MNNKRFNDLNIGEKIEATEDFVIEYNKIVSKQNHINHTGIKHIDFKNAWVMLNKANPPMDTYET